MGVDASLLAITAKSGNSSCVEDLITTPCDSGCHVSLLMRNAGKVINPLKIADNRSDGLLGQDGFQRSTISGAVSCTNAHAKIYKRNNIQLLVKKLKDALDGEEMLHPDSRRHIDNAYILGVCKENMVSVMPSNKSGLL